MVQGRPSQWPALFDAACKILRHFEAQNGFMPAWSFGGGTALMIQIDHRESHDVDLFLDDPQLLPFLNPQTQGMKLERRPDSYSNTANILKLAYRDLGEIDLICCASITDAPSSVRDVEGHETALETPGEIIAKKVFYRGWNFQPRDMFDLAAVAEHSGADYLINALQQCGSDKCETAMRIVDKATPAFVESINKQLIVRDTNRHLIEEAQSISRTILERTLAALKDESAVEG